MIISTVQDKPWSQYFCCMLSSSSAIRPRPSDRDQALPARRPQGRRLLRRRAGEGCAAAGRCRVRAYEYALQTLTEIQYRAWRDYDPEDTMRFYALRLHEAGMIKSEPQSDHRRGHGLALPERAQARAEGVRHADRRWSLALAAAGVSRPLAGACPRSCREAAAADDRTGARFRPDLAGRPAGHAGAISAARSSR